MSIILYKLKKVTCFTFYFVCLSVCQSVKLSLVRLGQLLRYADKSDEAKYRVYIDVYFCEPTDSMQYRPTNANLE